MQVMYFFVLVSTDYQCN